MPLLALCIAGTAALAGGALVLRRCWAQGPTDTGPWRYGVGGGWLLIAAGLALFVAATKPDYGLALGTLVAMAAPLVLVMPAAARWAPRPPRQEERDQAPPPAGKRSRSIARLVGCLLLAPILGLAAALAWRAYVPGVPADKLVGAAFAAPAAFAAAMVAVLGVARPWRAVGVVGALAVLLAAAVFLPRLTGV